MRRREKRGGTEEEPQKLLFNPELPGDKRKEERSREDEDAKLSRVEKADSWSLLSSLSCPSERKEDRGRAQLRRRSKKRPLFALRYGTRLNK